MRMEDHIRDTGGAVIICGQASNFTFACLDGDDVVIRHVALEEDYSAQHAVDKIGSPCYINDRWYFANPYCKSVATFFENNPNSVYILNKFEIDDGCYTTFATNGSIGIDVTRVFAANCTENDVAEVVASELGRHVFDGDARLFCPDIL